MQTKLVQRTRRLSCPRVIVTDAVSSYLDDIRHAPDPVLAEMEAHGARDGIPIVVPETGQLLQVLAATRGARRIVEVGTAIGVSIYIEAAYGLQGLGTLALQAFFGSLELPLILAVVTVITALVVAANLIVDAICVLVDPRVAREGRRVRTKSLAGGVI